MPVNTKYIAAFEENSFFHIYCKAVGNDVLFKNDENRMYFLNKYAAYTNGYVQTYSYCLLDNHVHWLVKCCSHADLVLHLSKIEKLNLKQHQQKFLNNEITFEQAIEFQFKDFFITYSLAFNKKYKRSGGLFVNPFKRIKVNSDAYFTRLLIYIHANPLKHKIFKHFQSYKWSSYNSITSNAPTLIMRKEVLDWFGGKDLFIKTHLEMSENYFENPFSIE
jgi:putative transposase